MPSECHAIPRLVIAGVSSNVGKTTVTVALARALASRGLRVATFKCGPDYLDPTYHRRASGRPCHNLDGWMMGAEATLETFLDATRDADIALIEGAMGMFDGASATSLEGSSAEIAAWLRAPVLLVVDARGMARSIAALAAGFDRFDRDIGVAGLFCNRVGSASHLALLRTACEQPGIPRVLGGMLADDTQQFPSRHLGLHAADEAIRDEHLLAWSERLSAHTDLDALLAVAASSPPLERPLPRVTAVAARCRIGVAKDAAFSFYYPYNLTLLEALGAELVPFSPIADRRLPEVDGLLFGGGYPELHAGELANNRALREQIRAFAESGRPVYGECGGLMYLSDAIVTSDGARHEMVGAVAGVATMQKKLAALGYVEVETRMPTVLGPAGMRFRGHQFRYSEFATEEAPDRYAMRVRRTGRDSVEGYGRGSVLASYVHAHWASNPELAAGFVRACAS